MDNESRGWILRINRGRQIDESKGTRIHVQPGGGRSELLPSFESDSQEEGWLRRWDASLNISIMIVASVLSFDVQQSNRTSKRNTIQDIRAQT
jgi:hypothetical protein